MRQCHYALAVFLCASLPLGARHDTSRMGQSPAVRSRYMQRSWSFVPERNAAQFVLAVFDDWDSLQAVLVELETDAAVRDLARAAKRWTPRSARHATSARCADPCVRQPRGSLVS